jgi:uncharacterized membrane protein YfcA
MTDDDQAAELPDARPRVSLARADKIDVALSSAALALMILFLALDVPLWVAFAMAYVSVFFSLRFGLRTLRRLRRERLRRASR